MFYMRYPFGKTKAVTLSYDDGTRHDIKLIDIMTKYGIKGTFNINTGCFGENKESWRLTKQESKELYSQSGMEVAAHCLTHADLTAIPPQCCIYEITEDKKNIEDMFGKICRGMAYPFGTVNDAVEACVRSSGILYSRTVRSTHSFSIEGNWLRLGTTCHHNDKELDALVNRFLELDVKFSPQLFYLWGHSFEFNINDNWNVIENFCSKIGNKNDTWYATNIEIFEYTEAYRRLVSNTEGTDVYNPNCISVWISDLKGEVKEIHPGERIKI